MFRECDFVDNFSKIDKEMFETRERFKLKNKINCQLSLSLDKLYDLDNKIYDYNEKIKNVIDMLTNGRNILNTDSLNLLYSAISISNNLDFKDSIGSRLDVNVQLLWSKTILKFVNLKMNQVFHR